MRGKLARISLRSSGLRVLLIDSACDHHLLIMRDLELDRARRRASGIGRASIGVGKNWSIPDAWVSAARSYRINPSPSWRWMTLSIAVMIDRWAANSLT